SGPTISPRWRRRSSWPGTWCSAPSSTRASSASNRTRTSPDARGISAPGTAAATSPSGVTAIRCTSRDHTTTPPSSSGPCVAPSATATSISSPRFPDRVDSGSQDMSVSLREHRLGGLRWIVLTGPDREAFGALGEHVRGELAALAEAWPVLPRLRCHVSGPPGRDLLAAVRRATAESFAAEWAELAAFAGGAAVPAEEPVLLNPRSDPGPDGHGLPTRCTLVADRTGGEAVIAARGEPPVAIPLGDLAEGNPRAQSNFDTADRARDN